jgi:hypothetical protein
LPFKDGGVVSRISTPWNCRFLTTISS